jgi:hypothetical protein
LKQFIKIFIFSILQFHFLQSRCFARTTTLKAEPVVAVPTSIPDVSQPVTPPTLEPTETGITSVDRRSTSRWLAALTASPLGIAVPFKYGLSAAWIYNAHWTFEAGYFVGRLATGIKFIDFASFSETLYTLQSRCFFGNSFNLSQQTYDGHLGNALVSRLSGGSVPAGVDELQVSTFGLQLGIGNRWQWPSGFTVGVDWFVLNVPFATQRRSAPFLDYATNPDDRDTADKILRIMQYIPTGALTKISIGYVF